MFKIVFLHLKNHVNQIISSLFFFYIHFFLVEPIDLNRKTNLKIDAYRCGYHNGSYDTYEYTEKHVNNEQFLPDLIDYINQKEVQLNDIGGSNKFPKQKKI